MSNSKSHGVSGFEDEQAPVGFLLCLFAVTSIAVVDGRFTDFSEFGVFSVVCAISVLASILLVSLAAGGGRNTGDGLQTQ